MRREEKGEAPVRPPLVSPLMACPFLKAKKKATTCSPLLQPLAKLRPGNALPEGHSPFLLGVLLSQIPAQLLRLFVAQCWSQFPGAAFSQNLRGTMAPAVPRGACRR